jgi:hypothetical protein
VLRTARISPSSATKAAVQGSFPVVSQQVDPCEFVDFASGVGQNHRIRQPRVANGSSRVSEPKSTCSTRQGPLDSYLDLPLADGPACLLLRAKVIPIVPASNRAQLLKRIKHWKRTSFFSPGAVGEAIEKPMGQAQRSPDLRSPCIISQSRHGPIRQFDSSWKFISIRFAYVD